MVAEIAMLATKPIHDGHDRLRGQSVGQQLDAGIIVLPQDPGGELLYLLSHLGALLVDFAQMLYDAGWADGFATIRPNTQQHPEFGIYCNRLAQHQGHDNGLGLLLLSHAGIDRIRRSATVGGLTLTMVMDAYYC
jgi:hypothetical protein